MSGIYIPNMSLPKDCWCCPLVRGYQIWQSGAKKPTADAKYCRLDKNLRLPIDGRPSGCPLHPIPDHGDLIDRDALMENGLFLLGPKNKTYLSATQIKNAPTIIGADKEEQK